MELKDYYSALGVDPGATDNQIKDAYRKLARQYHPDVNPGDKQAEERFKAINEAYQALSDPDKRQQYDALRQQYQQYQQGRGTIGFSERRWQPTSRERVYVGTRSTGAAQDVYGESDPFSNVWGSIFGQSSDGTGSYGRTTRTRTRPRRGRDAQVPVEITLEEALHGTTRTIEVGERRIEARVPPGVQAGARVRLAGQGGQGTSGGQAGDLYMVIDVQAHPQLERDGDDLITQVPVDVFTAVAGGEARVPTLDGAVLIKIPPRTQADTTFRLRGKGMPRLADVQQRGDLFARVKLVLPDSLTDDEMGTMRKLAEWRRGQP